MKQIIKLWDHKSNLVFFSSLYFYIYIYSKRRWRKGNTYILVVKPLSRHFLKSVSLSTSLSLLFQWWGLEALQNPPHLQMPNQKMTITSKSSQSVHSTMDHGTRSIGAVLGFDYIFPNLFSTVFFLRYFNLQSLPNHHV